MADIQAPKWIMRSISLLVLPLCLLMMLSLPRDGRGETPAEQETTPEGQEKVPEAPRKPAVQPKPTEEAKPELAPTKPGEFKDIAVTRETTLEVGPMTGILAPYGNPVAMDTLLRGWQSHRLGPVRISPFLEYDALYRTNIFQTSTDKHADFLNVINPGLRLEMPLAGAHRISMGYLGNYFIFTRFNQESHYDHNLNVDGAFNFPGGLSVRVGSAFRAATEEATAATGRERPYDRITPYFLTNYKLSDRWRLQGIYEYDTLLFADAIDRTDNYQDQIGAATLYYRFWPKTAALVQYIVTARTYPFSPQGNNFTQSPFLGLTWDPSAKLSGTIKFGYVFKNFENNLPGRNNSPDSFALGIQTLYRYSNFTQITLTAQRAIQEDLDFGNNAYENTAFFLTISHDWTYFKLTTYGSVSYTFNDYLNEVVDPVNGVLGLRKDRLITFGAGVGRPLTKWLRLRLDYSYVDRGSNFSGFTYNEHRVMLGVQSSF